MLQYQYDVIVIGGGPGGIEAARVAGQNKLKVALISATQIGGRATFGSLVPSKVWLSTANAIQEAKARLKFGLNTTDAQVDLDVLKSRIKVQSAANSQEYINELNAFNVEMIYGTGVIQDEHLVKVKPNEGKYFDISAEHIIVASGSGPRFFEKIKPNKKRIIAPRLSPTLPKIPDSLLMVGGGVTGMEYAYAFAALGTKVTILQKNDRILPTVDQEISEIFEKYMIKNLPIRIKKGKGVAAISQVEDGVEATLADGTSEMAEYGFLAIGRKADTAFFNPKKISFALSLNGGIEVNKYGQTNYPSIYTVGDVAGGPMMANKATMEARVVMQHILHGEATELEAGHFIEAVYTNPGVAQVGNMQLSEKSVFIIKMYKHALKARLSYKEEGMLKIKVNKKTGLIEGAAGFGSHIYDVLAPIQVAMNNGITYKRLNAHSLAYPSLTDLVTL